MSTRAERAQRIRTPSIGADMPQNAALGRRSSVFGDSYHAVLQWRWLQRLAHACAAYLLANAIFAAFCLAPPGSIHGVDRGEPSSSKEHMDG